MFIPIIADLTMWIVGAVVAIIILWVIGIFNSLVTLRNKFKNAFSQIDVQLKRRYDLIPNLVETVKGYMKHERGTLEAVIQARGVATSARESAAANPGDPKSMGALMAAEEGLGGALGLGHHGQGQAIDRRWRRGRGWGLRHPPIMPPKA